MSSYVDTPRQ